MIEMRECRYKKRLQFYLDGWLDARESKDFEEHLKKCAQCQIELTELEEVNSATLDIVDQAPDREYWDSFNNRVWNRIASRNAAPEIVTKKAPSFFGFRMVALMAGVMAVVSIMMVVIKFESKTPVMPIAALSPRSTPTVVQSQPQTTPPATSHASLTSPIAIFDKSPATEPKTDIAQSSQPKPSTSTPVIAKTDNPEALTAIDMRDRFKGQPLIAKAEVKYDDSYQSTSDLLASNHNNERGYRIKASILGERLLSGLNQNGSDEISMLYQGPLYNLHSDGSTDKLVDLGNEDMSTWGYLRVPSDTSKSGEIRKYLIELELMQSR